MQKSRPRNKDSQPWSVRFPPLSKSAAQFIWSKLKLGSRCYSGTLIELYVINYICYERIPNGPGTVPTIVGGQGHPFQEHIFGANPDYRKAFVAPQKH